MITVLQKKKKILEWTQDEMKGEKTGRGKVEEEEKYEGKREQQSRRQAARALRHV